MSFRLSLVVAAACAGSFVFSASEAWANGRYPAADELVFDPSEPNHMVVRATYGFIETFDGGAHWLWVCEEAVGRIGNKDPPLAILADGTVVVAVPFQGVLLTRDAGCSWTPAPAPLAGQLAVDLTREPSDPASLLVMTSTNLDGGFVDLVVETKDNGASWAQRGAPLPADLIAETIEVAPSNPDRIYVSGIAGNPPTGIIERSDDRGASWSRTTVDLGSELAGIFISAIDPIDPDVVYARIASNASDTSGDPPTTLRVSRDKGATWADLYTTTSSMLGFALSPDGTQLALGGPSDGVFVGPSSGGAFQQVSKLQNRCLRWTDQGLYACGKEPFDAFAVGLSTDQGRTYRPVYQRENTCPQTCSEDSAFGKVCRTSWTDPLRSIATLIMATGASCTVPWAQVDPTEPGTPNGDAGADAEQAPAGGSSSGCQLSLGKAGWALPLAGVGALGAALLARARGRRRGSPRRG